MSKKYIDISDLFSRNNLPQTFIKSQSTGNLPEESYTYDPFKSYTYAPFERPTQTPPVAYTPVQTHMAAIQIFSNLFILLLTK